MMFLKAVSAARLEGVVTTDLALYLSAHDPDSYSGTGATVNDISTNDNHATLTNGVTYSSSNGGYFELDAVNDFLTDDATTGTPFGFGTGAFTYEHWLYLDSASRLQVLFDARRRDANANNFNGADLVDSDGKYKVYYNTSFAFQATSFTFSANTWYHVVCSRTSTSTNQTRLYVNNELKHTGTLTSSFVDYGYYYWGRNVNPVGATYYDGRVAQMRVYKGRGLSAAEVTQNWNAHRRLYGL
jgi:hypothetical protein